jgi:hypothetical protein
MFEPYVFLKVYVKFKKNSETCICLLIPLHSYCRAIIGSKLAAFLAGYTPKNIPTPAEKKSMVNQRKRIRLQKLNVL